MGLVVADVLGSGGPTFEVAASVVSVSGGHGGYALSRALSVSRLLPRPSATMPDWASSITP